MSKESQKISYGEGKGGTTGSEEKDRVREAESK